MNFPPAIEARISPRFRASSGVGTGWLSIVIKLDAAISAIDPGYDIVQVKEKWGGLRFYYDEKTTWSSIESAAIARLVESATEESLRTCELCGEPGELRVNRPWFNTLCDQHR